MATKSDILSLLREIQFSDAAAEAAQDAAILARHAADLKALQDQQADELDAIHQTRAARVAQVSEALALVQATVPDGAAIPPVAAA